MAIGLHTPACRGRAQRALRQMRRAGLGMALLLATRAVSTSAEVPPASDAVAAKGRFLAFADRAPLPALAEERAAQWLRTHGIPAEPLPALNARDEPRDTVLAGQLTTLVQVSDALADARNRAADLDEAAAISVLAEAERRLVHALELPGAHRWLAEIAVQRGISAAQAGALGLAETAFAQAASLDPDRKLGAAEAPPRTVAAAEDIRRKVAARSLLPLLLELSPGSASAWLDGVLLARGTARFGAGDMILARSGPHVLVVRAPGHAPYATIVELSDGPRLPIRVALSATPAAEAEARLRLPGRPLAERLRDAQALASGLASELWLVELGPPPHDRGLVYRCNRAGCAFAFGAVDPVQTAEGTHTAQPAEPPRDEARARMWLVQHGSLSRPNMPGTLAVARPGTRRRWPWWVAAAALASGTTLAVIARSRVEVHTTRSLTIDPGTLPP